jgi:hypothetical protein
MVRTLTILACLAALVVLTTACGGDDDDSGALADATATNGDTAGSEDGQSAPEPADQSSGSGGGTFVVDGKTFDVEVFFCGFTPEETRNDNVPFSMRGGGDDNGRAFTVDGSIVDLGASGLESVSHDLELWYDDDAGNPAYRAGGPPGAPGDAAPEWVIDGKQVSLEGQFTGPDGADAGLGVLNATCP